MSVAIAIRDVPDAVRDALAGRAALAGMSMQEYTRNLLIDQVSRPRVDEVLAQARKRVAATGTTVSAAAILDARDADRR